MNLERCAPNVTGRILQAALFIDSTLGDKGFVMSLAINPAHLTNTTPVAMNSETSRHRAVEEEMLFSRDELSEFAEDDADAGRRIARILSALFIYTLLAMATATWWTFGVVHH